MRAVQLCANICVQISKDEDENFWIGLNVDLDGSFEYV